MSSNQLYELNLINDELMKLIPDEIDIVNEDKEALYNTILVLSGRISNLINGF